MKFNDGIQQYISRKHAEGIEFRKGEEYLRGLSQRVGDVRLDQVKTQHVLSFLDGAILMPPIKPKARQTFFPHVYSRAQLILLLKATSTNQQANIGVTRPAMRALLILLYGTEARIGEIVSLTIEDVNLELSSIIITNKNPNRCRQIPIGTDLCQILKKYLAWRNRKNLWADSSL